MNWIEYTILTTTEASDLVSQILLDAGGAGTMIEDKNDVAANQRPEGQWDIIDEAIARRIGDDVKVTGWFEADEKLPDRVAFIEGELRRLRGMDLGMDLGKLTHAQNALEGQDWTESWKAAFKPFRLGGHFVVRPSWESVDPLPGDHVIEIDPGMAFGTGTHETTGMCVRLVEKYVKPNDRVIDIGTGSGILAIAAAHMGAKPVLATDLDPMAARVAAENAKINGFGGVIEVRCGDLLEVVHETGDVVIANIIADVIVMLAAPVRARIADGGVFICSGIAADRRQDVLDALADAGYELLDALSEGEWCAMAARKAGDAGEARG